MRTSTSLAAIVGAAVLLAPAAGAPPVRISVPPGYGVKTFASGLDNPTAMAWGPDGRLYVTEDTGLLVVARRGSGSRSSSRAGSARRWASSGAGGRCSSRAGPAEAFVLRGRRLAPPRRRERSPFGEHQQDNVVLGRDGRLYLGSGSTCDVCVEKDPRSATVLSVRPDGTGLRIVARGLRNPYGLAFHPRTTGSMRRSTGRTTSAPPRIPSRPRRSCSFGRAPLRLAALLVELPKRVLAGRCRGVHAADRVPRAALVRGRARLLARRLFVALWGEYLRTARAEGRPHRPRPGGRARAVTTFARGFDHPLALAVDPNGGLLVADWGPA